MIKTRCLFLEILMAQNKPVDDESYEDIVDFQQSQKVHEVPRFNPAYNFCNRCLHLPCNSSDPTNTLARPSVCHSQTPCHEYAEVSVPHPLSSTSALSSSSRSCNDHLTPPQSNMLPSSQINNSTATIAGTENYFRWRYAFIVVVALTLVACVATILVLSNEVRSILINVYFTATFCFRYAHLVVATNI